MAVGYYQNQDSPEDKEFQDLLKSFEGSTGERNSSQGLFQGQDMSKLVKTYMEENIPENLKQSRVFTEFWAVLGQTIKLTFLEKEDVEDFEFLFDIAKYNFIMRKPAYEYGFDDLQAIDQLRIYFIAALKRSIGFQGHRFNERIILGGQINQVIRSNTESFKPGGGGGPSMMSKLRRLF